MLHIRTLEHIRKCIKHIHISVFLLVFLLCPHFDTLDTVGTSHYQPATDLLAHSEHIYPQSHQNLKGIIGASWVCHLYGAM